MCALDTPRARHKRAYLIKVSAREACYDPRNRDNWSEVAYIRRRVLNYSNYRQRGYARRVNIRQLRDRTRTSDVFLDEFNFRKKKKIQIIFPQNRRQAAIQLRYLCAIEFVFLRLSRLSNFVDCARSPLPFPITTKVLSTLSRSLLTAWKWVKLQSHPLAVSVSFDWVTYRSRA